MLKRTKKEEWVTFLKKKIKAKYMFDFLTNLPKFSNFQPFFQYIDWRNEAIKTFAATLLYRLSLKMWKVVCSCMCTTIHYKTRRFLSLTAFNEPSLALLLLLPFYAFFLPAFIRNIFGVVCCLCFAFSVSSHQKCGHI